MESTMDTDEQYKKINGLVFDETEMRQLGYEAVDLIVKRWSNLHKDVAWRGADRKEMEMLFRETAPEEGTPSAEILDCAVNQIMQYAGRIDHPRFFAFVPSSPTWPTLIADMLVSGFNVFQGTWLESAGPSQIELVVLDWFREWIGFPSTAGGVFTSGGSAANLCALVTARASYDYPGDPVLYYSDQGHASIGRAGRIAGFKSYAVRSIPTDHEYKMDLDVLQEMIHQDRDTGYHPLLVSANGGATNTGIVDPLQELSGICKKEDLWFHIDAAYGGFAVLCEEGRAALDGIDLADSVTLDPHKWLFQSYETGCLLVRDVSKLESAFSTNPEYLQDVQMGNDHVNFSDRGLQLSRSFRALKVWMSIKTLGLRAFREAIQRSIDLALEAENYIADSVELELLSSQNLGIVCYRYNPVGHELDSTHIENLNVEIQKQILSSGYAMVSSTRLRGSYSLRLCVMNYRSTLNDVLGTLRSVEKIGRSILS